MSGSTSGDRRNFPFSTRPTGWFQLGWSQDFPTGEVKPLRYMSRDLIAYRGASGTVQLMDAYCPHLGAHLGHGGCVEGDDIICPFHAWRFDAEGNNVDIPYSERGRVANKIECWTVREAGEVVYFWHDENGLPPQWDIPTPIDLDASYYPLYPRGVKSWRLPIYPQFIPENGVDFSHFKYMHGSAFMPHLVDFGAEGHIFRTHISMVFGGHADTTWLTPDGPVDGILETELHGLGLNIARFHGTDAAVSLVGVTPIDDDESMFFLSNWVTRVDGDESDELPRVAVKRIEEQIRQAERDHVIWSHMRYVRNPPTVPEETDGYRAVRDWARTFYPGEVEYEERVRSQSIVNIN